MPWYTHYSWKAGKEVDIQLMNESCSVCSMHQSIKWRLGMVLFFSRCFMLTHPAEMWEVTWLLRTQHPGNPLVRAPWKECTSPQSLTVNKNAVLYIQIFCFTSQTQTFYFAPASPPSCNSPSLCPEIRGGVTVRIQKQVCSNQAKSFVRVGKTHITDGVDYFLWRPDRENTGWAQLFSFSICAFMLHCVLTHPDPEVEDSVWSKGRTGRTLQWTLMFPLSSCSKANIRD